MKKLLYGLFCLLLSGLPVMDSSAMTEAELQSLFHEANRLFREANEQAAKDPDESSQLYRKAILRYERIIRDGRVENGKLFYDLGNAYFRIDDLGRAILNYLRAEQYIPNDPNLQQNLQYARSRRADQVELTQEKKILSTLFFWHYDLSAGARSVLFGIGFVGLWVFAAARLFLKRSFLIWLIFLSALLAVLMFGSIMVDTFHPSRHSRGVVVADEVMARKGDSETYAPSFSEPLHAGTEFETLEKRSGWTHVKLLDGQTCWLPRDAIEFVRTKG